MSKSIIAISPWILVLAFFFGVLAAHPIAFAVATYFNWNMEYGAYPTLRYGLVISLLWTYPCLVAQALARDTESKSIQRQMVLIIILAIANNTVSVYITESYGPIWSVIVVTVLLNIFCMMRVFSLPARILRSLELNRSAQLKEYGTEIFQFMLWPICVWWLQPRLVKSCIEERHEIQA